jgi:hypothetical protein
MPVTGKLVLIVVSMTLSFSAKLKAGNVRSFIKFQV